MKMRFRITSALFVLCLLVSVSQVKALEVDRNELSGAGSADTIDFINYLGPYSVINTVEEIRSIGSSLGTGIQTRGSAGNRGTYYVIHAVDPQETAKFDADIFILGPSAGVDHINNLRRIIGAYLETAYGYSRKDSDTLAVFITVYNAVYRGKLDAFSSRYKKVVMNYLDASKAGLAIRYDQWPGNTQIVIPLSEQRLAGTLSAIDTTSLVNPEVVKRMKEDEGAGIDTRKDMVDLKEREAEEAQKRAETAQKEATIAKDEAAQKKAEAEAAEKQATIAKTEAEAAKARAAGSPADTEAAAKAAEAEKKAETAAVVAETKKEESAAAAAKVAEKETEAAADQKLADTKEKETQTERKEIASDVQKEVDRQAEAAKTASAQALASSAPAYALKITDNVALLSELLLVDLNSGKILKTSALNSIRNRTLLSAGTSLMAVAGKKSGSGAVRLVLVNPETLELVKQGADAIAEASMLVTSGTDYYAVIENADGSFVLGRFDANLEVKAQSTLKVIGETVITLTQKGLLVQDVSGRIVLLRPTDLVEQTAQ